MKIIEYIIINAVSRPEESSGDTCKRLMGKANQAIQNGYQPFGNLMFSPEDDGQYGHYEQVMVKYEPKEEK